MMRKKQQPLNEAYRADFAAGLEHVIDHLQGYQEMEERALHFIRTNTGSLDGCMRSLLSLASAASLVAWFKDADLGSCKQWAYVVAKIERIRQQQRGWQIGGNPLVFNLFSSWFWLVSDCEKLITWRTSYEPFIGWTGDQTRPKEIAKTTYDDMFAGYQLTLALRGDWQRLGDRSERWLASPPPSRKKISPDMQFFLSLAKGDEASMETSLAEIVSPRQRRWRSNWQSGYTSRLISEEAVVYAKLAWRHGYQVDVDTPYIPKEWLPVKPLDEYTDPYDFMRDFDINRPLPD